MIRAGVCVGVRNAHVHSLLRTSYRTHRTVQSPWMLIALKIGKHYCRGRRVTHARGGGRSRVRGHAGPTCPPTSASSPRAHRAQLSELIQLHPRIIMVLTPLFIIPHAGWGVKDFVDIFICECSRSWVSRLWFTAMADSVWLNRQTTNNVPFNVYKLTCIGKTQLLLVCFSKNSRITITLGFYQLTGTPFDLHTSLKNNTK